MNNKIVSVNYCGQNVGRLAATKDFRYAFEYSNEWLANGFSISPFSLPPIKKVFIADREPFGGIFGVFNDSLPDGWGRLLIDRMLKKQGISPQKLSLLDRLVIVGKNGAGALEYEPSEDFFMDDLPISFDELSKECAKILENDDYESGQLETLVKKGGSSGGARPKVLVKIGNEDWIVKFRSSFDPKNIGKEEYEYSLAAEKAKIEMSETRLFEDFFFGTKRFDRESGQKFHLLSAGGLLETSHRYPILDYNDLLSATLKITRNFNDVEKMFRLMCFNVFAKNLDDHAKNFSFLYKNSKWQLSPAYDLTFSEGINGEHATTIDGEGKNPDMKNILSVARKNGISDGKAKEICEEVRDCAENLLLKIRKR